MWSSQCKWTTKVHYQDLKVLRNYSPRRNIHRSWLLAWSPRFRIIQPLKNNRRIRQNLYQIIRVHIPDKNSLFHIYFNSRCLTQEYFTDENHFHVFWHEKYFKTLQTKWRLHLTHFLLRCPDFLMNFMVVQIQMFLGHKRKCADLVDEDNSILECFHFTKISVTRP